MRPRGLPTVAELRLNLLWVSARPVYCLRRCLRSVVFDGAHMSEATSLCRGVAPSSSMGIICPSLPETDKFDSDARTSSRRESNYCVA